MPRLYDRSGSAAGDTDAPIPATSTSKSRSACSRDPEIESLAAVPQPQAALAADRMHLHAIHVFDGGRARVQSPSQRMGDAIQRGPAAAATARERMV